MHAQRHTSEPTGTTPFFVRELRSRFGRGAIELPVLADVAQRVMLVTERADVDARQLADLVRSDAAFAAHLLRIANSPAYAARTPIVSLQQAVSRLGMGTLRGIAVIISCKTRAFHVEGRETLVRELFRHSLVAALHAREIARIRRLNVEDAFLAGLLHDVGRPALIQAAIDLEAELGVAPLTDAELSLIVGGLHEEVGEGMTRAWGLAPRLSETIRYHHHPELAKDASAAALVQLADELSHHAAPMRSPDSPRCVSVDDLSHHPALATLNLYPEDLEALRVLGPELVAQAEAIA
jgi:putative nucleotidyltransferase with HDIG domain